MSYFFFDFPKTWHCAVSLYRHTALLIIALTLLVNIQSAEGHVDFINAT